MLVEQLFRAMRWSVLRTLNDALQVPRDSQVGEGAGLDKFHQMEELGGAELDRRRGQEE
jgi:hypothetical protein